MKTNLLIAFSFLVSLNLNAQKFREFKFQFSNQTNSSFNVSYETYDLKPTGDGTFVPINSSFDEKIISLDIKKKYVRFSGKSKGLNVNPIVFEIESLKKIKHGGNSVYIIIQETPKGTNIDLGNLVTNITNEHFYKLLTYKETERYGEDEVTKIGTIVIVDSTEILELSNIELQNDRQKEVVTNEYTKEETYFVDKFSIQNYGASANAPKFATNVNVSLIDSGFVEFKFKIKSVQHYTWNGSSPYEFLKTEKGATLVSDIKNLYSNGKISKSAQIYFISSYVKINDLVTTQRSFDKKGRDIHGSVSFKPSEDVGVAVVAGYTYQIKSGFVDIDSIKTARIMTSGKNISPLIASLITVENETVRIKYLKDRNSEIKSTIIELYDNIRTFKKDSTLKESDNIRVIRSNTSIFKPMLTKSNIEIPDSVNNDSLQNIIQIESERIARYNKNLEDLNTEMNTYFSNLSQIDIVEKKLSGIKEDEIIVRESSNQEVELSFLDNRKIKKFK